MKEQYVTYETAKLLKEKGFDWECRAYWHEDDRELIESQSPCHLRNITNPCWFGNTAPTQQMACDWVEETYGFFIEVWRYTDSSDGSYRYCYRIINGASKYVTNIVSDYLSKHEAVEAALQYVLTNLI